MALDFGKLNFSTSFNPTSAFPLDARCYFESKTAADTAALTAEEVGSSNTIYYFGQQIVVLENNKVTLYIIDKKAQGTTPETYKGQLVEVGSQVLTDDRTISLNNGALSLNEFGTKYNKYVEKTETTEAHYEKVDGFKAGLQPQIVVDADDSSKFHLEWFEPNPTTVEGLSSQITALDGRVGATETAIGTKKSGETPATGIYGDIDTLTTEVNKKVDAEDGKGLSTNDFDDTAKTKLEGIAEGAQVNVIEKIKVNGTEQTITDKAVNITIDAQAEYTIAKEATAESGYAATYKLIKDGTQVGASINIPKDMVVESGTVETCTEADKPVTGYKVGDKYIDLVIANKTSSHLYILVSDLIDVYTEGSGIKITNNQISVDTTTIATKKSVDDIVDGTTSVAKATSAEQVSDGTNTYSAANIKTIADKVDGITEGATKVEKSETNGSIKINGKDTVVYTLPTDVVKDAEYETKATAWTAKQDALTGNNGIEITADNKVQLVADLILDCGNAGATTE